MGYKKLTRMLRKLGRTLTVGIHEDAGNHDGGDLTVAGIGSVHEFGSGNVPARPFLRPTFDTNQNKYVRNLSRALGKDVDKKRQPDRTLNALGASIVADVQGAIRSRIPPPLAESTVAQKGSSTPLIDSGQLINSITHKVRK